MQVEFYGVRGSIACGGPDYAKYGGNTSCVAIRIGDQTLIVDAGTGLRVLGDKFALNRTSEIHLMLSHTHFDHVCGLPFFAPAYDPQVNLTIWSGHLSPSDGGTRILMDRLMEAPLFPVAPDIFKAQIVYRDFVRGEILEPMPGISVRTAALNHPNGATGYRFDGQKTSVVYASDHEHHADHLDRNLLALCQGADLMIYDATYTDASYEAHRGWGHSTWQQGLKMAVAGGVKSLALFHHDPSHTDLVLEDIEREAVLAGKKAGVAVFMAREGMVWTP